MSVSRYNTLNSLLEKTPEWWLKEQLKDASLEDRPVILESAFQQALKADSRAANTIFHLLEAAIRDKHLLPHLITPADVGEPCLPVSEGPEIRRSEKAAVEESALKAKSLWPLVPRTMTQGIPVFGDTFKALLERLALGWRAVDDAKAADSFFEEILNMRPCFAGIYTEHASVVVSVINHTFPCERVRKALLRLKPKEENSMPDNLFLEFVRRWAGLEDWGIFTRVLEACNGK